MLLSKVKVSINKRTAKKNKVLETALLSGIVLTISVGCTKAEEKTASNPVTVSEEVVLLPDQAGGTIDANLASTPLVGCDDPMAMTELMQTIKYTINTQTQRLLKQHFQQTTLPFALTENQVNQANNAVSTILIEIANPRVLQSANGHGMVTCQASLSLTLPSNDVYRAGEMYEAMGDEGLQQRLKVDDIVLNNNMLVSNDFHYVVGMQGGQAAARMVGHPVILTAVTDIIAKSQFSAAMEAERNRVIATPRTSLTLDAPALPVEPALPQTPPSPTAPAIVEERIIRPLDDKANNRGVTNGLINKSTDIADQVASDASTSTVNNKIASTLKNGAEPAKPRVVVPIQPKNPIVVAPAVIETPATVRPKTAIVDES